MARLKSTNIDGTLNVSGIAVFDNEKLTIKRNIIFSDDNTTLFSENNKLRYTTDNSNAGYNTYDIITTKGGQKIKRKYRI